MNTNGTTAQVERINHESLIQLDHLRLKNDFERHFILSLRWMG